MRTADKARLRKRLSRRAQRFTPLTPGYDDARALGNLRFNARPAFVVMVATDGDVAECILFARALGLRVSVRSGGESPGGYASNTGGMMIHLGLLDTISIDRAACTATVGTGVTLGSLYTALGPTGLMLPMGECTEVGIGGITLGGGISLLSRSLGLTCDSLLRATVVTADGMVREASASSEPDLFWALRGAGAGNFGVVTSMTFRLHALPPEVAYARAMWPLDQAAEVLTEALQWFESGATNETDAIFSLFAVPPQPGETAPKRVLAMLAVYNGPPAVGSVVLRQLTGLGKKPSIQPGSMPYTQLLTGIKDPMTLLHDYYKSGFVSGALPYEAAQLLADRFASAPELGNQQVANMVGFELPSGAVRSVAPGDTAFPHRRSSALISICATWHSKRRGEDRKEIRWADELYADLRPYLNGQAYQNYADRGLKCWAEAYYGVNLPRLRMVKRAYDPENVFRYPQGISPA